jgi:predicted acetyltransferase
MSEPMLRPVSAEEFPAYFRSLADSFLADVREDERELELTLFEPERSLAAFDEKDIVGTGAIYSRTMTVPGAQLPIAGVSLISVAPTHRRRGILTSIMRRQLTELHEQAAEPVAVLWASEAVIYQRYGYGAASYGAMLSVRTGDLAFRREVDFGAGRVRMAAPEEARTHLAAVYEAVRGTRVGLLDRRGRWWDYRTADLEHWRNGGTNLRYALYEEPDGQVAGYAIFRVKGGSQDEMPNGEVRIRELIARTPQAHAALWAYLAGIDLTRTVLLDYAPVDEPLPHLVGNPRLVARKVSDQLWVRLADVGRALRARRYATELDVVFEVADPFCPWNAGRWRLSAGPTGALAERTTDPADLALTSTELGAAYLGGTALTTLAAAGRVTELRPGALRTASLAFGTDRQPWCAEVF